MLMFLDGFVKNITHPVTPDGRQHVEYTPTQVLTEYLRWASPHPFDGIALPSAQAGEKTYVFFRGPEGIIADGSERSDAMFRFVSNGTDAARIQALQDSQQGGDRASGAPRITADLSENPAEGERVNQKRVARVMRQHGLPGRVPMGEPLQHTKAPLRDRQHHPERLRNRRLRYPRGSGIILAACVRGGCREQTRRVVVALTLRRPNGDASFFALVDGCVQVRGLVREPVDAGDDECVDVAFGEGLG